MTRIVALDKACEFVTDGTHYTPKDIGAGVPFLTVKDVNDRTIDLVGCSFISEADYLAARAANSAPRRGDVLFSKDGTVGKVHVVATDQPFAVLSSLAILRPRIDTTDAGYLGHALRSPAALDQALKKKTGSAIRRIVLSDLRQVQIPLPPLPEQRRIAAILDQADALRARRREALAQLDSLTQSIFIEMFGDSCANPKRWPTKGIEAACELIVDCVNRTAPVVEGVTPYKMIRTTNVKSGKVSLDSVRYVDLETFTVWNRRATPRRGDVLLTREAPVGEAGILTSDDRVFLGQRLMLYRPAAERITSEYLLASFRSPFLQDQFEKHGSGSTVKHLPLPACRAFELRMPPLSLQQAFATRIQAVESLKATHLAALAEGDALFDSLQHRAFAGQLS